MDGVCGVCRCLIAFLLSTERRRKDPEEFWSSSRVGRLKTDDEEGLASQQETQMIFFIQQVARRYSKTSSTLAFNDDTLLG